MRGSPLFRTFLILVVLGAAGLGFARLTAGRADVATTGVVEPKRYPNLPIEKLEAKVYLTLSGGAKSVDLFANAGYYKFGESEDGKYYANDFKIAVENPVLDLKVVWLDEAPARRFAKLVVEADGKETFTHVFDADGDIDDFIELPF